MRDKNRPTVLIVDDTSENLDILVAALTGRYSVAGADLPTNHASLVASISVTKT
ncbi:hypothetical protein [Thiorhodovibrio frisius]|uniref:Response regulatory domain-containing protein n=1 Tax=Thiorhodovibrio frisius TaxID=631362 RepID=H8YYP1_9GAMM|nr:hypothetical protein [Thiorhodovibrio frisius]EIC23567.1 hypothetical protein Thi970DRAFT_01239 [Thiorhodovibrio frisius]WPL23346.1 hypothetical protein Thiofri_03531 [Thiorhodovibrio frisius]